MEQLSPEEEPIAPPSQNIAGSSVPRSQEADFIAPASQNLEESIVRPQTNPPSSAQRVIGRRLSLRRTVVSKKIITGTYLRSS